MSSTANSPPTAVTARDWLTPVELLVLGAIWGASFLFMRIAAADFGPFALVEIRLALGALVLLPFLWRARRRFTGAHWWRLALIGSMNSAIPFVLFAWAAERAPAGIGAICNAMAVLFTALVAFVFYGVRVGRLAGIGLLSGFVGVVVLAGGKVAGASIGWAVVAGTLAALLYGIAANLVKRHLADLSSAAVAAATLLCATLLIAPFAAVTWPDTPVPAASWLSAVLLGVLCTGLGFALYYRLIHRIGAPRAVTVTYLVPLFGVGWAWVILGEPLTPRMAIAGVLILAGVALSQRKPGA